MVNLKSESLKMSDLAQKIDIVLLDTDGNTVKTLSKKVLSTMTVSALKAMLSKLFKVEVLNQILSYKGLEDPQDFPIDEDFRQLKFFSIAEGGSLFIRTKK